MLKRRIVICDDHQVVIEGLKMILQSNPNLEVVGSFLDASEFREFWQIHNANIDVVLMDAHLKNDVSGLELRNSISDNSNKAYWVLFSSFVDKYLAVQAKKIGFQACISKEIPAARLIQLLEHGSPVFYSYPDLIDRPGIRLIESVLEGLSNLTKTEKIVLNKLKEGKRSKESADELNVSVHTFETHKKNIFRKLNVNSTTELMSLIDDYKFIS
ncbi:MAG: response regulator transcription factor [Bacteroidia bacterium]|nr:response regulator transcription factor [Bacteroidia bacterium]